jgi:hypothetical protein
MPSSAERWRSPDGDLDAMLRLRSIQGETMSPEREIVDPVDLCDQHGRLNEAARGWSRVPNLRANLRGAIGRKKRWDYWCVIAPDVIVSFVYADIDYAGLSSFWILDRGDYAEAQAGVLVPLGRGFSLPEQVCSGTVSIARKDFELTIEESDEATRLTASAPASAFGPVEIDLSVAKPAGHESLNVVIPWSDRRFQFTSKQNSRPATGTIRAGARSWEIGRMEPAFGVQDLGRGIWPYKNRWNWASASGLATDGRIVGLQFGGKWTEGTGFTENALCIDGVLTKIHEELEWTYDWDECMRPWRVRTKQTDQVDVELRPFFDRHDSTDLKIVKMEVHQCFGRWSGRIRGADDRPAILNGIDGFAEEARNRW